MNDYSRKDKDPPSEDKSLELRLGPPGEDSFINSSQRVSNDDHFFFSNPRAGNQGLEMESPWKRQHANNVHHRFQQSQEGLIHVMKPQPSQPCNDSGPPPLGMHCADKKAFSQSVHNVQKRIAPGPVVGCPPVRSFRKNLASGGSSKSPPPEPINIVHNKESDIQNLTENLARRQMLVKINMDGIPVGRKVDLKACDSYEKLSQAVDKLFRGFLASAQNGSLYGIEDKEEGCKTIITGLLDGSEEYTPVYEDNEGDRMLVGDDVPWNMFVSTVKRLRVLKSLDIPTLSSESTKETALS